MFITMTGDLTAFLALIFGYFFFWTIHPDFPPPGVSGPGWEWPLVAAGLTLGLWALMLAARLVNTRGRVRLARWLLGLAMMGNVAAALTLMAGPWSTGLDPTTHAYPAIVWALVLWIVLHFAAGLIMQA
jgi:cytochrome c oxidase subunit I+III